MVSPAAIEHLYLFPSKLYFYRRRTAEGMDWDAWRPPIDGLTKRDGVSAEPRLPPGS